MIANRDDRARQIAIFAGCSPVWEDGIIGWAWHCTCPDNRHGHDSQCSVITVTSAERGAARARPFGCSSDCRAPRVWRRVLAMTRVSVGFFIRRTWKNCPPGETLCAQAHRIYPTHEAAVEALVITECAGYLDPRFDYDIAEAWMHVGEEES